MECIAAFYSHFGALEYARLCAGRGWRARLAPVPRALSSSCGTCVRYESGAMCPVEPVPATVEQIVRVTPDGYETLYRAKEV